MVHQPASSWVVVVMHSAVYSIIFSYSMAVSCVLCFLCGAQGHQYIQDSGGKGKLVSQLSLEKSRAVLSPQGGRKRGFGQLVPHSERQRAVLGERPCFLVGLSRWGWLSLLHAVHQGNPLGKFRGRVLDAELTAGQPHTSSLVKVQEARTP